MAKRWCWRKALGLKSPHVTEPSEISPGVVRPSYALAGMVAGAIIAKPDKLEIEHFVENSDEFYQFVFGTRQFRTGFHRVRRHGGTATKWSSTVGGKPVTVVDVFSHSEEMYIYTSFQGVEYDDWKVEDKKLIQEALRKAKKVAQERENAKKEAEKQQKALDIIEKVFSTPEPEPETHYEYDECDCDSGCDCCQKPAKRPVPGCEFSCCKPKKHDHDCLEPYE